MHDTITAHWCTFDGRELLEISLSLTLDECLELCVDQKGSNCTAVEFWFGDIRACFQCTNISLAEPYDNVYDLGFPVHVWIKGEITLRIPPHERSWGGGEGRGEGMRGEPE